MSRRILAHRYAVALADVAEKQDKLETVRSQLDALSASTADSTTFEVFMASGRMSKAEKQETMRLVARKVRLESVLERLLMQLVDKERLRLLDVIAEEFSDEADRRLGIREAEVVTAVELSGQQRQKVKSRLGEMTGKQIRMIHRVDPSLLAGLQVRLDNMFFEGSLKGRLRRLRERMSHA